MKIDKTAAIARRNQQIGSATLGANNTLFASLNPNKNIWWFNVPVGRIRAGQAECIHLLLHNPVSDELYHLRIPTAYLRNNQDSLETRNKGSRSASLSLELSADRDSLFQDVRPASKGVQFAKFLQGQ